jgi:hypothetical protein
MTESTWNTIFRVWRDECQRHDVKIQKNEILFVDPPNEYYDRVGFWITRQKFDGKIDWRLVGISDDKGIQETINLLSWCETEEQVAAAWISATIQSMKKKLPRHWRGETYRIIEDMQLSIVTQFESIDIGFRPWHHASKYTLPFHLDYKLFAQIRDNYDLIDIIAIESMFNYSTYMLFIAESKTWQTFRERERKRRLTLIKSD